MRSTQNGVLHRNTAVFAGIGANGLSGIIPAVGRHWGDGESVTAAPGGKEGKHKLREFVKSRYRFRNGGKGDVGNGSLKPKMRMDPNAAYPLATRDFTQDLIKELALEAVKKQRMVKIRVSDNKKTRPTLPLMSVAWRVRVANQLQKYRRQGKSFDEVIAENKNVTGALSPELTRYWRNRYNSGRGTKVADSDMRVEFAARLKRYPNNNWTESLTSYYVDGFDKSNLGWEPRARVQVIEDECSFDKYARNGSHVGPFQISKDVLQEMYGRIEGEKAYGEYVNKVRKDKDIAEDMLKYDSVIRNNIATEEDNLGYGRQKIQQYAKNRRLDDRVSSSVWNNNILYEIKKGMLDDKLDRHKSTYRNIMDSYDSIFYQK